MYRRILVAIDDSPASTAALDEAVQLARDSGAALRIVHLVDEMRVAPGLEGYGACSGEVAHLLRESGEQLLLRAARRAEAGGGPAQTVLVEGFAISLAEMVLEQAESWRADLIVLGTQARAGMLHRLFGSGAERVVRMSTVPVLLVHAPGDRPSRGWPRRVRSQTRPSLALQAE